MERDIGSAVNFQEIVKELLRRGIPRDAALKLLDALHIDVRANTRKDAVAAPSIYPATREHGSGLGERTCMALTHAENHPALTADQAWLRLRSTA